MIRALIFDLDDTLYRESDFVSGGYRAVAHRLEATCGAGWEQTHEFMMAKLARAGRRSVFPAVLERFPAAALRLEDLVSIYRGHIPEIRLYDGYAELLRELRKSRRLGLVTDGNPRVQRAKCEALRLEEFFDQMIFTWDHGEDKEKPHPFAFRLMLDRLGVDASEALFIGDNVEKDCRGARAAGMKSVRVRKQGPDREAKHEEDADIVIDSLLQLPLVLTLLGGQHEAA
jgi:putative hydrolase of the HAD superfamily